jgi:hypothetical protein
MMFRMPTVRKHFARFLKEQSRPEFLLPDARP